MEDSRKQKKLLQTYWLKSGPKISRSLVDLNNIEHGIKQQNKYVKLPVDGRSLDLKTGKYLL